MKLFNKRQFLQTIATLSGGAILPSKSMESFFQEIEHLQPQELAQDDAFWQKIRAGYGVTKDFIQLENGYYSLAASEVLENYIQHIRQVNAVSSYYMRTRQGDDKLASRQALAKVLGCSTEELIITRNTTESLDTIIAGIDWKAGDEALMAEQDYGAMLDMFKLQARRYGIVNRMVSVPLNPASDEEIVELYEKAITPKTRLLMICHLINITGHILP
ncbi:MAG TPA: aminotransferase class V-fold PLP-dependent enzyme, partial [Haliscomenobacter sp.]|uniref:aminotransferase class V-fold PLP-dependent enzyme n=1 Tax=Haliscomenobacter sp. TaxID=2717303 RepID=UPI002C646473